jgi:hypothetical protein
MMLKLRTNAHRCLSCPNNCCHVAENEVTMSCPNIGKPPVQATPAVGVAVTLKSAYKFKKPIFVFHQK